MIISEIREGTDVRGTAQALYITVGGVREGSQFNARELVSLVKESNLRKVVWQGNGVEREISEIMEVVKLTGDNHSHDILSTVNYHFPFSGSIRKITSCQPIPCS